MNGRDDNDVTLTLLQDQALVLFEWLARTSDVGVPALFVDQAEELVLWDVEGMLECSLVTPLLPNYRSLLDEAPQSRSR